MFESNKKYKYKYMENHERACGAQLMKICKGKNEKRLYAAV